MVKKSMEDKLFKSNIGGILFLFILVVECFSSYLNLSFTSSFLWLLIDILFWIGLVFAILFQRKYKLKKTSEEKKEFFWQARKIFLLLYIFYYVFLSWFANQSTKAELIFAIVALIYIFILIVTNILKKWTHLKMLMYIIFLVIIVEGLLIFSYVAFTYITEKDKDISFPLSSVGVMNGNIDYIITPEKDYDRIGVLLLEQYLENRKSRLEGYTLELGDPFFKRMIATKTDGGFNFEVGIYINPSAFSNYWGNKKTSSPGIVKIMTLIVEEKENGRYELLEMRWK